MMNTKNRLIQLVNESTGAIIDRAIHDQIAIVLRKIHHIEKNTKAPANKEARDYLVKRAKEKASRHNRRTTQSQLEPLVVAMVNTEQFKYNYNETRDLTIYQFNESVRQIIRKVDYDNLMHGIYAGTINSKEISKDRFNWLTSNN